MQLEVRQPPNILRETSGDDVHDAPNAPADQRRSAGEGAGVRSRVLSALAWAVLPGLVLGVVGPFGTFGTPLLTRFAYWLPTMAAGALIGAFAGKTLMRLAPELVSRRAMFFAAQALLITAAMVGVVWGWGAVVFGVDGVTRDFPALGFYVAVVALVVTGLRNFWRPLSSFGVAPHAAATAAPVPSASLAGAILPALARRLKPELRAATILALEAEDHYVRIHTALGSELVLMRLADAIAEMAGVAGAKPHRSWWVAADAAAFLKRENGRMTITLKTGVAVPVSRAAASAAVAMFAEKA